MTNTLCGALNTNGVRCRKAPHDPDEQHSGITPEGHEIYWLETIILAPGRQS